MAVNSEHKIRFAQDLALYNLTLTEEIEGFDGAAHIDAWNNDPEWQGVRRIVEALTAVDDDWGEIDLRHQHRVRAAARRALPLRPGHAVGGRQRRLRDADGHGLPASTTTPSATCAGPWPAFAPLTQDREFADHNKEIINGWLAHWVPLAIEAARTMQPLWSQPDAKPPRFEDSLDRAKNRFAGILTDLGLETPKELNQ